MKTFINIVLKKSPERETLSFNPNAVSHFLYKEAEGNRDENSLHLTFSNGRETTLIGEPAGKIHKHLISLEQPIEAVHAPETTLGPTQ